MKCFTLISSCKDGFSWRITTAIKENGSFDSKGLIRITNNKEDYQKHKEHKKQYRDKNDEEIREYSAKRRGLGYTPLNEHFKGAHGHHPHDLYVVFIPADVHNKYNGKGFTLERHRGEILEWIFQEDLDLYLAIREILE